MALVQFATINLASYAALETKDPGTLYFVTDEQKIYKGDVPYSGGSYLAVTEYPETAKINTLYINTTDGSVRFYNGADWISVVKPIAQTVSASSTHEELATAKAIYNFVVAKVAEIAAGDMGDAIKSITERIDALDIEVAKKAEKATTLAGYGIEDAYTKDDADTAIATAIAGIDKLTYEIVDTLPALEEAKANVIYLVSLGEGAASNQNYEEFMLINSAFEKIGDTALDLTGYAKEEYVDGEIQKVETNFAAADATTLESAKAYIDEKLTWTAL